MMPSMWYLSDGTSSDDHRITEQRAEITRCIEGVGWAVQPVEAPPPMLSWAHTIGLTATFGHPELLVVGAPVDEARIVLHALARGVCEGTVLRPGHAAFVIDLAYDVGLVDIHPEHLAGGLVAAWFDYYDALERPRPAPFGVLQVVIPDADHCHVHQLSQPLLDDPRARLLTPVLNRATRRAEARRHRARAPHARPPSSASGGP
jgi:hypothetical protein